MKQKMAYLSYFLFGTFQIIRNYFLLGSTFESFLDIWVILFSTESSYLNIFVVEGSYDKQNLTFIVV